MNSIRAFFGSKIGSKLLVPYFLTSLVTLSLLGGIMYYNYWEHITATQELESEIALKASTNIDQYLKNIIQELQLTGKNIRCTNCLDARDRAILSNTLTSDPSVYELVVLDTHGKEVARENKYANSHAVHVSDTSEQEKFKNGFVSNTYYLSPPYTSIYGLPSVSLAVPLFAESGERTGVLIAEIDLSPMWEEVTKVKLKETGYVYVMDTTGHLIAYRDVALVREHSDISASRGAKNFINDVTGFSNYPSFTNQEVMGTWQPIGTTGWGLVIELPQVEILKELTPLIVLALLSFVVLMLFSFILVFIIFRELVEPIHQLHDGVLQIEKGNLTHTITVHSRTEVGDLAESFNKMSASLTGFYANLEEKVAERTLELESAEESLEKQVGELGRMNRLMINREVKMVELKKEIAALEGTHHTPPDRPVA